mmetsp:Transcript_65777/g.181941  ORF Transcript_65777/g.181941 Transcript_65777/m.181941 type:complete len:81 (-) Transcript_65777:33-275(-)
MHRRMLFFLAWVLENLAVVRPQAEQAGAVEAALPSNFASRPASAAEGDAAEWGWSIASIVRRQRVRLSEGQIRPQPWRTR